MVRSGRGVRETARYFGVMPGTVSKWMKRAPESIQGIPCIHTRSSRPHHHPNETSQKVVDQIIKIRKKTNRCAEVVHKHLSEEGVVVSLSTVKRVLGRTGLVKKKSKWKKLHRSIERPDIKQPGDLVQIDTIHMAYPGTRDKVYIYTLLDVFSRWACAWATTKIGAQPSVNFIEKISEELPFKFQCLQSDNGSEFSAHFTRSMNIMGVKHRHNHVRSPKENGHLERFNRTVQEECLYYLPHSAEAYNRALQDYMPHYNTKRFHLGINLKTPQEMLKCFQAID